MSIAALATVRRLLGLPSPRPTGPSPGSLPGDATSDGEAVERVEAIRLVVPEIAV
jgi:hypothetical protein